MIRWIAKSSPQRKTRIAGGLFLLLVLTSACTEFFFRGRSGLAVHLAAGIVEVSCMVAVTLLLYDIFKPVQRRLSFVAACINLVAVALELLQLQPHGINIGLGLHGLYWLLIGWLIFRSAFLPRILGALLGIAGVCWLIFLSPRLGSHLSRYSLALALITEGFVMLWLFVMGLNLPRWRDQAAAVGIYPPR